MSEDSIKSQLSSSQLIGSFYRIWCHSLKVPAQILLGFTIFCMGWSTEHQILLSFMIYQNRLDKRHHANNVKLARWMIINLWMIANVLIKIVDIFYGMLVRLTLSLMTLLKNLRLLLFRSLEMYQSLFSKFLLISKFILIILKMLR